MTTDIHFHVAGVKNDAHIYISESMRNQPSFKALLALLCVKGLTYSEWMMHTIHNSKCVDRVVALAFDWVYDKHGKKDKKRSHFWVDNNHVATLARENNGRILFGASVNPNRKDCLDMLTKACAQGAVLNKLIPSSQDVDLLDPRHKPFFELMRKLQLPLLCHTGVEHTIPPAGSEYRKQELNHPTRLSLALECGVKVIAAHCGLPVNYRDSTQAYVALIAMFKYAAYKNLLYGDLAGLMLIGKPYRDKMVKCLLADGNIFTHDRLILGSDFPIIPYARTKKTPVGNIVQLLSDRNVLDSNVEGLTHLGFSPCVLSNADNVLRLSKPAPALTLMPHTIA